MNNRNNISGYHPATVLLMADGTTRRIDQIVAGDFLMGITGNAVRVTDCERVDNTGTEEHPHIPLFQLNLALNNEPLILTENQLVFVRNNFRPIMQLEQEENRTINFRVHHFNGRNVEGRRFYVSPRLRVYISEQEARQAAIEWSDSRERNAVGQARYDATRQRMHLVEERETHITYGAQTKRPIRYFFWPRNADIGKRNRQNVQFFDTREQALGAAQQMSAEDVIDSAPPTCGDFLRPGFFHIPEQKYFEVRYKDRNNQKISKRFKYNETHPSYETQDGARQGAQAFIQSLRNSLTIPHPGQTFRFPLRNLLDIGNLVNRERFPLVLSPGLNFEARELTLDPYYLGAWLGDGTRNDTSITQAKGPELVQWLRDYAKFLGMRLGEYERTNANVHYIGKDPNHIWDPDYRPQENRRNMVYTPDLRTSERANWIFNKLVRLGVTRPGIKGTGPTTDLKHIPDVFKFNSREVRLKVLAGLIDSDGSYSIIRNCFQFSQSALWHSRLFHSTVFLARSLGYYCGGPERALVPSTLPGMEGRLFDMWFTTITGHICEVPCLLPRKQPRKRTKKRSHLQLSVRSFVEVTEDNSNAFYSIHTDQNEPFLRDTFLILLPSNNGHVTENEEAMLNLSYQDILQDETETDIEPRTAREYSERQASDGAEEEGVETLNILEDDEGEGFDDWFQDDDEEELETGEEVYDEEAALSRAIQESRITAARAASGPGESSSSAARRMVYGTATASSSTAAPGEPSSSSATPRRQQPSRKGKERADKRRRIDYFWFI